MAADRDMVALFKKELELCKVGPGEAVGVLSEDRIRQDYAEAFLAAADELGADAMHVNIKKRPGSTFGPGSRKFPLCWIRVARRRLAGSSTITGKAGTFGLAFSSAAISSRIGFDSGAIDR